MVSPLLLVTLSAVWAYMVPLFVVSPGGEAISPNRPASVSVPLAWDELKKTLIVATLPENDEPEGAADTVSPVSAHDDRAST